MAILALVCITLMFCPGGIIADCTDVHCRSVLKNINIILNQLCIIDFKETLYQLNNKYLIQPAISMHTNIRVHN